MAAPAVIIELGVNGGKVVNLTVADGVTISKGMLCKYSGDYTAAQNSMTLGVSSYGFPFAGIASADKLASDGSTTLGFYTEGVFDITASTTTLLTPGNLVCMSGANTVTKCEDAASIISGAVVGRVEESASAEEVVRVRLGL